MWRRKNWCISYNSVTINSLTCLDIEWFKLQWLHLLHQNYYLPRLVMVVTPLVGLSLVQHLPRLQSILVLGVVSGDIPIFITLKASYSFPLFIPISFPFSTNSRYKVFTRVTTLEGNMIEEPILLWKWNISLNALRKQVW